MTTKDPAQCYRIKSISCTLWWNFRISGIKRILKFKANDVKPRFLYTICQVWEEKNKDILRDQKTSFCTVSHEASEGHFPFKREPIR